MKKNFLFSLFFLLLLFNSNAENLINKQRLISANSWLYQALNVLFLDTGDVSIVDVAPYSYEEFYFYFSKIDYSTLSENSKILYKKVENFLTKKDFEFDFLH